MGKDWLHWIGGGGSGNTSSATKKAAESASSGCMSAVVHLFHSHQSHSHPNIHPFLQEEPTTTRGVEAPRNSLEMEDEDLSFQVGIQIKTKPGLDEISSECNSPAARTPIVARLMGLDLLPQSTSPSISSTSPKCRRFFLRDEDAASGTRSLPETPRVSSSSRKSDVDRHRLSLQINKNEDFILSDHRTPGRRSRFKQNENRNLMQKIVKQSRDNCTTRRSVGTDITNTVLQLRRDENLLIKPARKNSDNEILSKHDVPFGSGRRALDQTKTKPTSSSCENHVPSQKECKRASFGARCNSSSRLKKLPPRAAAYRAVRGRREGEFVRSRETSKLNLRDNILQVKKFKRSSPPTKLPQKQVSDALSSKTSTQLPSKLSQSFNQLHHTPPQTAGGGSLHGGSSPEQRNYIQTILNHTGIINQANLLSKWHTPSHPIDPGIFRHLELSGAASNGGDTVLSHQCNRKLIFQLIDELLAEMLTPRFSYRGDRPVGGGGFALVDELCKRIDGFPAAKCVVLEDIDSLIDTDLCKSRLNGYLSEKEEMVCEIESEMVEWLLREAVAVMGGDAVAEEKTTNYFFF